jgi:hypothetical protein
MVGLHPSILRSWEKDKGVPCARATGGGRAGPGRGRGHGEAGGERADRWGVARFFHSLFMMVGVTTLWVNPVSYHLFMMTGVTTLWVNPGSYRLFMMAGVTTLWVNSESYRLFTCPSPGLPAWALLLPLRANIKKTAPVPPVLLSVSGTIRPLLLLRKVFPVSYLCAHREMIEQAPSKPLSSVVSAQRVRQLGSWGATTWLLIPSQRHLLPLDAWKSYVWCW